MIGICIADWASLTVKEFSIVRLNPFFNVFSKSTALVPFLDFALNEEAFSFVLYKSESCVNTSV